MRYHNITKDDMKNGDGLRVVLWVSGCSHCCKECHNPVTWDANSGILFTQETKKEIFEQLEKEYISGITFSGGDPLYYPNRKEITSLAKEIKALFPDKTIWLYTGFLWEEIVDEEIILYLDVCVDGPFLAEEKDSLLMWKGSRNQRVIDVKKTLVKGEVVLHCNEYAPYREIQTDTSKNILRGGLDS